VIPGQFVTGAAGVSSASAGTRCPTAMAEAPIPRPGAFQPPSHRQHRHGHRADEAPENSPCVPGTGRFHGRALPPAPQSGCTGGGAGTDCSWLGQICGSLRGGRTYALDGGTSRPAWRTSARFRCSNRPGSPHRRNGEEFGSKHESPGCGFRNQPRSCGPNPSSPAGAMLWRDQHLDLTGGDLLTGGHIGV
jgi:hypothetical protein